MGACTPAMRGCCAHDGRLGEYEFSDIEGDPNSRLTLTNKQANNVALMKHIKNAATKLSLISTREILFRAKTLEKAAVTAPVMKLKVDLYQRRTRLR